MSRTKTLGGPPRFTKGLPWPGQCTDRDATILERMEEIQTETTECLELARKIAAADYDASVPASCYPEMTQALRALREFKEWLEMCPCFDEDEAA